MTSPNPPKDPNLPVYPVEEIDDRRQADELRRLVMIGSLMAASIENLARQCRHAGKPFPMTLNELGLPGAWEETLDRVRGSLLESQS